MAKKSASNKSTAANTAITPDVVTSEQVGASAGVASALATVSEQEGDRTAAEKQKGLARVAKIDMSKYENKPLTELAAQGGEALQAAFIMLVQALPRMLNTDFVHEAPLAEVLSGEAADRGALSSTGENPDRVDDAVLPAGTQATDDMLPPNILTGDVPKGFEKHPGVVGAGAGQ